jgi:uncharacterized damage-inducible protein DinB
MRLSTRALTTVCAILLAAGFVLAQGQQQNQAPRPARTQSQELLSTWNDIHHKLVAMAEDFPEDKYDFKVQKDERTFAENLLHIAGVDYEFMNAMTGKKMGPDGGENPPRTTYKSKADVVKWIRQATDDGAALIKEQGDEGLNKEMKYPFGNSVVHTSFSWWGDIEHCGEHYGQLVVYYRANDMVPPDSRPQPK